MVVCEEGRGAKMTERWEREGRGGPNGGDWPDVCRELLRLLVEASAGMNATVPICCCCWSAWSCCARSRREGRRTGREGMMAVGCHDRERRDDRRSPSTTTMTTAVTSIG